MSSCTTNHNKAQKDNDSFRPPPAGVHVVGPLDDIPSSLLPVLDSDPTANYKLNHSMLRIRNPKASLDFYVRLMGMRRIFTLNTGPETVFYLGYPQTAAHKADPALFARETVPSAVMSHTLGLLELCHQHGVENQDPGYLLGGSDPPHLGFGHLGFTVPDVAAAIKRLREEGVEILKDVGEGPIKLLPISTWEKEKGVGTEEVHANFLKVLRQIGFIRDPVSIESPILSFPSFLFLPFCGGDGGATEEIPLLNSVGGHIIIIGL